MTDADLKDHAQSDGDDIAFFDSNGVQLSHEIELYDPNYNSVEAQLIGWVKVDLSSTVDTKITMKMVEDEVGLKTIHYAPALEVNRKQSKGMLHLIPNNPHWISGNAAFWTACVHGHKNIYLIGFDFREYGKGELNNIYQDTENYGERNGSDIFEQWLKQFRDHLKMRPYCNFTIVHDNPPEFLNHLQTGSNLKNSSVMSYKEFNDKVLGQRSQT